MKNKTSYLFCLIWTINGFAFCVGFLSPHSSASSLFTFYKLTTNYDKNRLLFVLNILLFGVWLYFAKCALLCSCFLFFCFCSFFLLSRRFLYAFNTTVQLFLIRAFIQLNYNNEEQLKLEKTEQLNCLLTSSLLMRKISFPVSSVKLSILF